MRVVKINPPIEPNRRWTIINAIFQGIAICLSAYVIHTSETVMDIFNSLVIVSCVVYLAVMYLSPYEYQILMWSPWITICKMGNCLVFAFLIDVKWNFAVAWYFVVLGWTVFNMLIVTDRACHFRYLFGAQNLHKFTVDNKAIQENV